MEINDKGLVLTEKQEKNSKKEKMSNEWITGEYKWVPIGTTMPSGWNKVDLKKGFTLVQGTNEETTTGDVIKHIHHFEVNNTYFIDNSMELATAENSQLSNSVFKSFSGTTGENDGNSSNLGAGMAAELWKYEGSDDFIKGEYKWVMVGTEMPSDWVNLTNTLNFGWAVVEGTSNGSVNGIIQKHTHEIKGTALIEDTKPGGSPKYRWYDKPTTTIKDNTQKNKANPDNRIAGKFAELWVYGSQENLTQ